MARHRRDASSTLCLLAAAVCLSAACSAGSGGCSGMAPIPGGAYQGPKVDNALNVRVSEDGFAYLNEQWPKLIGLLAPNQLIEVPLYCSRMNVPGFGDVAVADQGSDTGAGWMDGQCTSADRPAIVPVEIAGFSVGPSSQIANALDGNIVIEITTGRIYASSVDRKPLLCGGFACLFGDCPLSCRFDFDTARSGPSTNTVRATIAFTIDARWDNLLSFGFAAIEGTTVCGASGAAAPPLCLDPDDLHVVGQSNCGSIYCGAADFAPIKSFILQQISPTLETALNAALRKQSCEPCGPGLSPCRATSDGATSSCSADGVCVDDATGACVPRFLGIEGRVAAGELLSGFGLSSPAQLDVSVAVGGSVSVDSGLNVGTVAGVRAVEAAACVPSFPAPLLDPVSPPPFDVEAPLDMNGAPRAYHVAIAASQSLLDLAMYQAHQAGALCATLSTSTLGALNTGVFKTFLPSLGALATRDGKDAPMAIVLRPAQVPRIAVGAGTSDAQTGKPLEPLLELALPELIADVYALIDERWVRLFSITADVQIPLSLAFEQCSMVTPVLGDLQQMVTHVRTTESELLAEDPAMLADLLPTLIGYAEPALAAGLPGLELPEVAGFRLEIIDGGPKGLSRIPETDRYRHVGLYARLVDSAAPCSSGAFSASSR